MLALAGGAAYLYSTGELTGREKNKKPLKTAVVKKGDLRLVVAATGVVVPKVEVEVRSKAAGEILSFPFDEGDRLEKGQVVVRLDPDVERSRVKQAEAALLMAEGKLEKAKVSMKDAELKLRRKERLLKDGIISRQEYDDALLVFERSRSDVKIAEAELIRAKEQLKEAKERLDDTEIRAPLTGTILKKFVEEGQVISSSISSVSGGTLLFTMDNLDEIYVSAMVDEVDVGRVRPGQQVTITVDTWPDKRFPGRVLRIAPKGRVERTVTVFDVIVEVTDNQREFLKPGMTANVEILTDLKKGVTLVPNEAIRVRGGATGVFVATGDSVRWVKIEPGDTDGLVTEVKSGLRPGQRVVLSGAAGAKKQGGFGGHMFMYKKKK